MGAQVCNASGSGYDTCTCSGGSGTGGATGSVGTSGTAGATGSGGSAATGGSTGGRGGSGVAGTTGSGGSASAKGGAGGGAGTTGAGGATGAGGQNVDAGTKTDGNVSSSTDGGSSYTGRWVSVQIVDEIVAPGKADGTAWDGTATIPDSVLNALGTALAGGDPVGGTLAVLAGPDLNNAISNLDKPDPYGYAQATTFGVTGDAYWLADRADAIQDDYTPIWPYGWHYTNVPIDSDVRILVELWDEDLIDDDAIGAAEINSTDLMNALAAQEKFYVRVDGQTDGQLLFIGISVVQQTGLM